MPHARRSCHEQNSFPPHLHLGAQAKWLLDILASALGLLILSPFFAILALAIKRDSPGPVFYRGRRAARMDPKEFSDNSCNIVPAGYSMPKTFDILKFRNMYKRPENYQGAKQALSCHFELVEELSKGLP